MTTLWLILKNLRRNLLRSTLTALGTMMLVFVVTLVWSILQFLSDQTSAKNADFKAIVTERWQIPSQMPFAYAESLQRGAARNPEDERPTDSMTWSFYGGTLDPLKRTRENVIFAFAMEPDKLRTMMDDLDNLTDEQAKPLLDGIAKLKQTKSGIILGIDRLKAIKKKIGDRFKIFSFNYRDINLEFEIVGVFPDGRYNNSAAIRRDYLMDAMDAYPKDHAGKKHFMSEKNLNLVWLRVPNYESFKKIEDQILSSGLYTSPAVKCETASSGISTFLDSYRDLLWGMRWLLAPSVLATLALVTANAISIGVRERRTELAVMKVLGFQPRQLFAMVVGEALLIGGASGLISSVLTWCFVNQVIGGIKFPIAFFGAFLIPTAALYWGVSVGAVTALAGSIGPALTARAVKVAEVFSRVG